MRLTPTLAALVGAVAVHGRTFAVLHHFGKGPLVEARVDPVVNPGAISGHVHTVMGASNFGMNSTGESLLESSCSTALIKGDKSAYWFPKLYFQDPKDGHFEPVELFYMNVYYFFESTNDKIQAFPVGLKMLSGDSTKRTPPNTDGSQNLDPSNGPVNPVQWTCPHSDKNARVWPEGSDGTMGGIQDGKNTGSGVGFPFGKCNGYASPLRADIHFPSCYDPSAGLENFRQNTYFPSSNGNGGADCKPGHIHLPHLFYEVYWNTPKFDARWNVDMKSQPFILANGDRTGYGLHADFIAGWDVQVLQQMIDNCDAGDRGMDKCPGLLGGLNKIDGQPEVSCNIPSPINEVIDGVLTALPGNNPPSGWGVGSAPAAPASPAASSSYGNNPAPSSPAASASTDDKPAPTKTTIANPVKVHDPTTAAADSPTAPAPSPDKPSPTTTAAAADSSADSPAGPQPTTASVASGDDGAASTVWETVTEWKTTTVFGDNTAPTATPEPATGTNSSLSDVAGFKYAGCFKDSRDRALAGEVRPNLGAVSNSNCVTYCKSKGWALAGTEYGGQCYCGNSLTGSELLAESACSVACEGENSQICGGGWALSVYSTDGSAKVVSKRHLHNHLNHHRRGPSARRR